MQFDNILEEDDLRTPKPGRDRDPCDQTLGNASAEVLKSTTPELASEIPIEENTIGNAEADGELGLDSDQGIGGEIPNELPPKVDLSDYGNKENAIKMEATQGKLGDSSQLHLPKEMEGEGCFTYREDNASELNADTPNDEISESEDCFAEEVDGKDGVMMVEDVGSQQYNLGVGDCVWAKTKTALWWPGMICDPANASKTGKKHDTQADSGLLVKYFGNNNFVWCSASQLRPFIDYFDQMSHRSKSSSFVRAVDKAASEIGRCVHAEMTCSCTLVKCPDAGGSLVSHVKKGKLGTFSVSLFDPFKFLTVIQNVARHCYVPGKIEFNIIKNSLSAFYCSLGHHQLSIHKLRPSTEKDGACSNLTSERNYADLNDSGSNDVGGGDRERISSDMKLPSHRKFPKRLVRKVSNAENSDGRVEVKSGKAYESRERKKSKYLSYPYVNIDSGDKDAPISAPHGTKYPKGNCVSSKVSASLGTYDGNSLPRNLPGKPSIGNDVCDHAGNFNVDSTIMLCQLRLTALGCVYANESGHSNSIQGFFSTFRRFAFLKPEIESEHTANENKHELAFSQNSAEVKLQTGGGGIKEAILNKCNKLMFGLQAVESPINFSVSKEAGCQAVELPKSDAARKKRATRKGVGASTGLPQIGVAGREPDLNSKDINLSVESRPVDLSGKVEETLVNSQSKLAPRKRRKKKEHRLPEVDRRSIKFAPVLNDVQVTGQNSLPTVQPMHSSDGVDATIQFQNAENQVSKASAETNISIHSSLTKDFRSTGQFTVGGKPERKRRKRKEKPLSFSNKDNSPSVPDLNGNVDFGSSEKDMSQVTSVTPEGKPLRKRRRRTKKNATGNMLVLNFASGFSLPPKESLIALFSRFGPLKESETLILNDSSAQVVFVSNSNAEGAFRSLEKNSPFGAALANYSLCELSASSPTPQLPVSPSLLAKDGLNLPPKRSGNGNASDLLFMKQNLEMMTRMVETEGHSLTPDMKAKLESEIKGLMKKIGSMAGSSSC